jgi:hypothetical protein
MSWWCPVVSEISTLRVVLKMAKSCKKFKNRLEHMFWPVNFDLSTFKKFKHRSTTWTRDPLNINFICKSKIFRNRVLVQGGRVAKTGSGWFSNWFQTFRILILLFPFYIPICAFSFTPIVFLAELQTSENIFVSFFVFAWF